jgi:short-subunit dehydrogenase
MTETGRLIEVFQVELSDKKDPTRGEAELREHKSITALVNNAGVGRCVDYLLIRTAARTRPTVV